MSFPLPQSSDKSNRAYKKNDEEASTRESDPLLQGNAQTTSNSDSDNQGILRNLSKAATTPQGFVRARRGSKSPVDSLANPHFSAAQHQQQQQQSPDPAIPVIRVTSGDMNSDEHDGYEAVEDATVNSRSQHSAAIMDDAGSQSTHLYSQQSGSTRSSRSSRGASGAPSQGGGTYREAPAIDDRSVGSSGELPPLLEIPEEIYAVRKAALQVLKPLTKTWIVVSVGFALTVLFGMTRWTRLLPGIPFWFILLPCWSTHIALLWLHVSSARALSSFIADANDSRQRADSRDHLNRSEYLPLLQRSLKFGLKTGLLSFCVFIFEILIYIRLAHGSISLTAAFIPLWLLVTAGIVDGLVCKTQNFLRVICWILTFAAMVLTVMKVDFGHDEIRWRVVVSPIVAVLIIASATLIYIVYGHQVGYYRLTESQLTAGNLYSLAALICIVLIVMIGEVIPLSRPVEMETRMFVVILAPLVACLVGMGAWVVSRDEFGRLLLYGGQSTVHPMKLKWEAKGWTSVQGKGVTIIPMFGEVFFRPLELKPTEHIIEICKCCQGSCYPYEEEDEENTQLSADIGADHPYLDPNPSRSARALGNSGYNVARGGT